MGTHIFFETLEGAEGFGHRQLVLYLGHILVLIVNVSFFSEMYVTLKIK